MPTNPNHSFLSTMDKMPDMSGTIANNATLTLNLPLGRSYEKLFFHVKDAAGDCTEAELKSLISSMIISVNGNQCIEATSTFMIDRASFYGDNRGDTQADNGILCWDFTRGYIRGAVSEQAMRLGTQGLTSVTVKLKLSGTGSSVVSVDVYAERGINEPTGEIICVYKMSQSYGATGVQSISDLRRDYNEKLVAFHITQGALSGSGAGAISGIQLKINSAVFYETVASLNTSVLKKAGRAPISTYYVLDCLRKNVLSGAIPTNAIEDLRLLITWSAAPTTFDVIQEVLASPL